MILTIVLNPSVEKTLTLESLSVGERQTVSDHHLALGDSGIYSAYCIRLLQGEPYVIGFAGGIGGRYIKYFTDKYRIKSDFLWKDQESRFITRIQDHLGQVTTLVNPGFELLPQDIKNFKLKFNSHTKDMHAMVLNMGHSEGPHDADLIDEAIQLGRKHQMKLILSLREAHLRHALHYKPFGVVLNPLDLSFLNIFIEHEKDQIAVLREMLISDRIGQVYYYNQDAIYAVTKNKIAKVTVPIRKEDVEKMKDLLVGTLSVCASRGYEIEKTLKLMGGLVKSVDFKHFPDITTRKSLLDSANKTNLVELYNHRRGFLIE